MPIERGPRTLTEDARADAAVASRAPDELRRILAAVVANIEQLQRTTNRVEHALAELVMAQRETTIRDKTLVEPEGVDLDWSDHPEFSGDVQPRK